MTLIREATLSLRPLAPGAQGIVRSDILRDGHATGKHVEGAYLEAAFRWNKQILLLATDDIPNEETLRIYLLDGELNVLDWARLGAMYSTGHLSALEAVQPDVLRFRFIGETTWAITLLPAPVFRLPVISDPRGVRRPLRLYRAFELDGKPRPAPRG
jgi:hypothetical protein